MYQTILLVLVKKSKDLDELCGYYGEKLVLKAQELGLNTCWVAMTYKKVKTAFKVEKGEKLDIVIALGYGEFQGIKHRSKAFDEVSLVKESDAPDWYKKGIEMALLAPTAMNQQKFEFDLKDREVSLKAKSGFYTKIDKGIVKYHFEIGAGKDNFTWKK